MPVGVMRNNIMRGVFLAAEQWSVPSHRNAPYCAFTLIPISQSGRDGDSILRVQSKAKSGQSTAQDRSTPRPLVSAPHSSCPHACTPYPLRIT